MASQTCTPTEGPRLRSSCLNFSEILAQAIALISPTMTAALIVPVMYANAGEGSWLAYAFGTIMLLFVALNLNQFARRSASSGSMYAYISRGLGPTAGGIAGWCLIWAYLFIGIAGLTGLTNFAERAARHGAVSRPRRSCCSRSAPELPGMSPIGTFKSPPSSCWCWKASRSR